MASFIICVDDTDHSICAVEAATQCSHPCDHLTVMTVVHEHPEKTQRDFHYMDRVARLLKYNERKVSTQLLHATGTDASGAIVAECDGKCDIIVTGTRGRGMLAQKFLGSVSARLVSSVTESAVLVVPNRKFPSSKHVHCICMTDGSEHALRCVKLLAKILHEEDSVLFFTCFANTLRETSGPQVEAGNVFHQYGGRAKVSTHSVYGLDAARAVLEVKNTRKEHINFIAVGCRGTNPLQSIAVGSTPRALLQSGACPVLVCRAPRYARIQLPATVQAEDAASASTTA